MDENKSAAELEAIDQAAFDADWEDAPDGEGAAETGGEAETGKAEEAEDQRPEEDGGIGAEADEAAESTGRSGRNWKLKHNGEEVDADEAKMVELAQKGLDYDRVRGERDSFKNEHPKYTEYEKFLTELAESAGTDVNGLMENVRASMLMQKAEAAGKPITQDAAKLQLRQEAEAAKAAEAAQQESQKKQANLKAFMAAYPGVKAEDIPLGVLKEGFESGDLAGAYARYENKQLKSELETLKQNQKNKERSTGSMKSTGSSAKDKSFDALWYDDD